MGEKPASKPDLYTFPNVGELGCVHISINLNFFLSSFLGLGATSVSMPLYYHIGNVWAVVHSFIEVSVKQCNISLDIVLCLAYAVCRVK